MKRRTFLQRLSSVFFAHKMYAEPLPSGDDFLYNGTVWQSPNYCICIVQFLDARDGAAMYSLLSAPYNIAYEGGGTAMTVCRYSDETKAGKFSGIYTEDELRQKLTGWKQLTGWELRLWDRKEERLK